MSEFAEVGYYPDWIKKYLADPATSYAYALAIDFGGDIGMRRWWRGVGTLSAGGHDWEGFDTVDQLKFVGLSDLRHPDPRLSVKNTITIKGLNKNYIAQIRKDDLKIYGAKAWLYVLVVNADTYEPLSSLAPYFWGFCGHPTIQLRDRQMSIDIDSAWFHRTHASAGRLNNADQILRHPGDRGLEMIGASSQERLL